MNFHRQEPIQYLSRRLQKLLPTKQEFCRHHTPTLQQVCSLGIALSCVGTLGRLGSQRQHLIEEAEAGL